MPISFLLYPQVKCTTARSFAVKLEVGIEFNPFYMFGVVT